MVEYIRIKSIRHLNDLCKKGYSDFFVRLNGGVRSSKNISYNESTGEYSVLNEIDGSFETIGEKDFNESFIAEALEKKALYMYDYESQI